MGVQANFLPNDAITYIPNAHAAKNPFLTREAETGVLPTYEGSQSLLPKPYWQGHEDAIACHDKAWQIAFSNLRMPVKESGFVSAFIALSSFISSSSICKRPAVSMNTIS